MLGKNRIDKEENGITFVPLERGYDSLTPAFATNALINYKATSSKQQGVIVNPSIAVEANEALKQHNSL